MRILLSFMLMSVVGIAVAQPCNYTLDFFLSVVFRPNRHGVRDPRRFTHFCDVQPEFQWGGGELPIRHDGVHLRAQWRLCGLGWLEHSPHGRLSKHRDGANNSWPGNWNTTANGFYTYTLNTNAYGLNGSGVWSVTIQNAWTGVVDGHVRPGRHLQRLVRRRVL